MAISLRYASNKNKDPILNELRPRIEEYRIKHVSTSTSSDERIRVLEIASGTGEHCAYFCSNIPCLLYQPTEPMVDEMHASIDAW
eukprot:CAMPEP_0119034360 /NCGR_PEP_ID=MMETSP1177-20130426/1344_1 /TAXON_ID=2985 /ORGANISM="Ochromonas sp, Strain CCMP1899" /LENGTH=84 /DNA_ID=CAMNT_0006991731 /DNA_START=80 /DNA_END=331 /DNA_ORIENTATION=+